MNLHAKLYTINIKLANCAYRVTQCYTSVNALAFLFSSIVERTCRFIILQPKSFDTLFLLHSDFHGFRNIYSRIIITC